MLIGLKKTNLNIYNDDLGSVLHGIKKDEPTFKSFGEVYFSKVKYKAIKAWKKHNKMTLNLVVPVGEVLFYFKDLRKESKTYNKICKITLCQSPYFRLTVPPGLWFGFRGVSKGTNIVCNVADLIHDKNEVSKIDLNQIKVDWRIK